MKDKAVALLESDIGGGEMLLGIVCAMDKDVPQMRQHFEKALLCHPDKATVLTNYCIALYMNGFFGEAVQRLSPAYAADKSMSLVMANACMALGLVAKARNYYEDGQFSTPFDDYCANFVPPVSAHKKQIFDVLEESLEKDDAVWKDLSNR